VPVTDPSTAVPARLSLVLPAYNEAENIRPVVERALRVLPRHCSDFEIIVVNDGSHDETANVAGDLAAGHPEVRLVNHDRNRGYGAALTSGFEASTGRYVMFMDSDRQFDIEDIDRLLPFVDSHEIVAGFRMERTDPLHRRVFAEIFNVSIRILFGVHMRDIDCAFKIFRGDLLRSIVITSEGALINTEIMAKARRQGAQVQQVGVRHFPRVAGTPTGGNPRVIIRAMRDTPRLWLHMRTYQVPEGRPIARRSRTLRDSAVITGIVAALSSAIALIRRR
jgi:glycosyltransferase involved in cell wall biosynthesis